MYTNKQIEQFNYIELQSNVLIWFSRERNEKHNKRTQINKDSMEIVTISKNKNCNKIVNRYISYKQTYIVYTFTIINVNFVFI